MKSEGGKVVFLVSYVDEILLLRRDIGMLSTVKVWLAKAFDMKDLGEASYILQIKLHQDRENRMISLSQATYIDKVLVRFAMQYSKKGITPLRHGMHLSKDQCPQTPKEKEQMRAVLYALAVGSLIYTMLCTRPDITQWAWSADIGLTQVLTLDCNEVYFQVLEKVQRLHVNLPQ